MRDGKDGSIWAWDRVVLGQEYMGTRMAAGAGFGEEAGVGVGSEDHCTGAVGDAIRRVRGDIVEELGYFAVGVLCGLSLLGADGAESRAGSP